MEIDTSSWVGVERDEASVDESSHDQGVREEKDHKDSTRIPTRHGDIVCN